MQNRTFMQARLLWNKNVPCPILGASRRWHIALVDDLPSVHTSEMSMILIKGYDGFSMKVVTSLYRSQLLEFEWK